MSYKTIKQVEDLPTKAREGDYITLIGFNNTSINLVYISEMWEEVKIPVLDLKCPMYTVLDVYGIEKVLEQGHSAELEEHTQAVLLFLEGRTEICYFYDAYANKVYIRTLGLNNIYITSDITEACKL